jgi:hypothetical protein
MRLFMVSLFATFFGALPLASGSASAQSQVDPANLPLVTAEQARDAFAQQGFQTSAIVAWGWAAPTLRTFEVRDSASPRVVMVLVFASSQDAGLFRGQMARHAESTTANPYLIAGYGPSMWRGNVALVQSTESQLQLVDRLQADQDNGTYDDPGVVLDARAPAMAVDPDFQEALTNSIVNL